MKKPLVTIGILSYNRKKDLQKSLEMLRTQTYDNLEVIVVDNASADGTVKMVRKKYPEVKLVSLRKNIGIEGWNRAFERAKGKYTVVLDDDAYLDVNAILNMVEIFERNPDVGTISFLISDLESFQPWKTRYQPHDLKRKEWFTFIGCAAGFRTSVIRKAGLFSKEYFLASHELAPSIEIRSLGYKIIFAPECKAYHRCVKGKTSPKRRFFSLRNNLYFIWKYYKGFKLIDLTLNKLIASIYYALKYDHPEYFLKLLFEFVQYTIKNKRRAVSQDLTVDYDRLEPGFIAKLTNVPLQSIISKVLYVK